MPEDHEDEGEWLILRKPNGDHMGFAPFDLPTKDELERLYVEGWRLDKPN